MNKSELIRNAIFTVISMGEMYVIFGKKYITLSSFLLLGVSYGMGKALHISLQEDNAGGTTPYNPLKIPAKHFTPGGTTPHNPLKIPAKKITPAH